jgi:hypothetical protein
MGQAAIEKASSLRRNFPEGMQVSALRYGPVKIAKQFCWVYPAKLNFLLSVLCGLSESASSLPCTYLG